MIRYRDTVSRSYGIVIQYHDMISFFFYDILLYFYFSKFFYEIKSLNQRIGCTPQASGEMVRVIRLTTNQGTSRRGLGGRIRLKMGGLYIMAYADIICCPTNVPPKTAEISLSLSHDSSVICAHGGRMGVILHPFDRHG